MDHGLEAILNVDLISTWHQYSDSLASLTTLSHTDAHFDHILTGPGYDGQIPMLQYFNNIDGNLEMLMPSPQQQKVLFVHRHSLVLQNSALQYKTKRPLLFYLVPAQTPGKVKLWMSARTHSHMLRGSFGLNFSEHSAHVLRDKLDNVKFYLSSQSLTEAFKEQSTNLLSCYNSTILVVPFNRETEQDEEQHTKKDLFGCHVKNEHTVYALRSAPALWCAEWPEIAVNFASRRRKSGWPSRALITTIINSGCYIVPRDLVALTNDLDSEFDVAFPYAEKKLQESLSPFQTKVFYIVMALMRKNSYIHKYLSYMETKYLIYWAFEAIPLKGQTIPKITNLVFLILGHIQETLQLKTLPNYFIPECNMINNLAEIDKLDQALDDIKSNLIIFMMQNLHLPFSYFLSHNHVAVEGVVDDKLSKQFDEWKWRLSLVFLPKLQEKLWDSFQDTAKFYVLSTHTRLHRFSLNESIIVHREILRVLDDKANDCKEHVLPFLDIVQNSLGALYHAKATKVKSKQEKAYFLEKSEELLRLTKNMDKSLGRVRLGNLLYKLRKYAEGKAELINVHANLERAPITFEESELDVDNESQMALAKEKGEFATRLWHVWDNRLLINDICYTKLLRSTCLKVMDHSISMAMCPVLGENTASIFSAQFHAGFLLALCHAAVRDFDEAKHILRNMERNCELEVQVDHNDKRNAAYMLILAKCYKLMGCRDEAMMVLHLSMMLFPSPRNEAGWQLMTLRYGETWENFKDGAKVMALASALSLSLSFVEYHISW